MPPSGGRILPGKNSSLVVVSYALLFLLFLLLWVVLSFKNWADLVSLTDKLTILMIQKFFSNFLSAWSQQKWTSAWAGPRVDHPPEHRKVDPDVVKLSLIHI